MESGQPPLTVVLSPAALRELDDIWQWNITNNGPVQAQTYLDFLFESLQELASDRSSARTVNGRPDLKFITMRWRKGGHGHVAVFQVDEDAKTVTVAHVFHTRQNWQERVKSETP